MSTLTARHGEARHGRQTPEYRTWAGIISRCTNPAVRAWPYYGGRGITVCDRWRWSFEAFLEDMGRRPSSRHSIDRINNDGNYEPGNCRWATAAQQVANRRSPASRTRKGEAARRVEDGR